MSIFPANDTFRKQQSKLVRATFKKGFINAINVGSNTLDVYYADNPQSIIKNLPVAKSVDLTTAFLGQRCRIDLFDETNPNDSCVAYVF